MTSPTVAASSPDWFDWTEYERLIGEFIRTYKEGETVGVTDGLKTLKGNNVAWLLRKRQKHKMICNRLRHGGHLLWAKGGEGRNIPPRGAWYPCSMSISFIAQIFLGMGYREPVCLQKNKRDLGAGQKTTGEVLKSEIALMRCCALVCECATRVDREKANKDSFLIRIYWTPNAKAESPIIHVKPKDWSPLYDETAQELAKWRGIDQAVGAFLRAWSEILIGLRELEIMMANPSGPSNRMDLGSAETDMKRAEKVLGNRHPVTRGLMDMAKERALIVHGDRKIEGIVDQSIPVEEGVCLCSVQAIKSYIEPVRLAVKSVSGIVDERREEWGHSAATLP